MSSEYAKSEYPKIVRDKIPEIIAENTGSQPEIITLIDDEEYLQYLLKKASEEGRELSQA
jgi:predicted house-cleaning noncanonical NTP pyrophosphatase (MazG superfamily)